MSPTEIEAVAFVEGVELARYAIASGSYTLGRAANCDLYINADLVSRRHARLGVGEDGALVIEDLGSSNGTFLDDVQIAAPTPFAPHQSIRLGAATLVIQSRDVGASTSNSDEGDDERLPPELTQPDRYEIGAQIAQGGMGAVLAARQPAIRRQVAMKVMLRQTSPDDRMRFIEEAQITGQLEHPNIVPVHELGLDAHGQPFYTMKLVKGITFKKILDLLEQGVPETVAKYPLATLLTVFQKVCDAVAFAHSKGVIHRDLKPANIMVGKYGEVLVMDWGLAKVIGTETVNASAASLDVSIVGSARQEQAGVFSTLDGSVMGTPQYMSPEQAIGETATLDPRSDIYTLGAILYHLLALRPPVSGRSVDEVIAKVARGEVEWEGLRSPSRKDAEPKVGKTFASLRPGESHLPGGRVPDSLAAVVRKALSLDRAARYPSVADLQADVLAYQSGFATSAENAGAWKQVTLLIKRNKAAALGIAAVLLVGGVLGTKAILEGRRAERGEAHALSALADLKKTAPSLLVLAVHEASLGNLEGAEQKLTAVIAIDPSLHDAYLQRGWLLIAQTKWGDALAAFQVARTKDPAPDAEAEVIPIVEKISAMRDLDEIRVSTEASALLDRLKKYNARGAVIALEAKLRRSGEEQMAAIQERIVAWLGAARRGSARLDGDHLLTVDLTNSDSLGDLTPLTGLPIENLILRGTKISSLEPLRGMPLRKLDLDRVPVSDLSVLVGMPLRELGIPNTKVTDITALRGLPLRKLNLNELKIRDLSPLREMPLVELYLGNTPVTDLSPLAGLALKTLNLDWSLPLSLLPIRNCPIENLSLTYSRITDFTPLKGMPIRELNVYGLSPRFDLSAIQPLPNLERLYFLKGHKGIESTRGHPTLNRYEEASGGSPPTVRKMNAAEFWKEYDAKQAVGAK